MPWLVVAGLVVALVALLLQTWTYRKTLAAQARDMVALREQCQDLIQTNQQMQAERAATGVSLGRSEKDRQRLLEETQRLQADYQRLVQEHRNVTEARGQLESEMRNALESRDITISELAGKLTVSILDRVLFASGEAEIKAEGQEVLRQVARVLTLYPDRQIQVTGHTDNVPIRTARFPSNWELSTARAIAAVRFLTEQAGVEARRLGAVGHGEFHPVADNATPEGRAQNRRIAIVVLPELLKAPVEQPAGTTRVLLTCRASTNDTPIVTLYSFALAGLVNDPKQADMAFYFDKDDCAGGAIVGHRDEKGWLFPLGKHDWAELQKLEKPAAEIESVAGIRPINAAQEGQAFWLKTNTGRHALVRIARISPATFDELAHGKTATVELEWVWKG